ncbi:MAG: hypothetical protein M1835_000959 [Candelina submexicana]|nr:MAG: hypothetical protein M1835_000959 [Candelina submexicana]
MSFGGSKDNDLGLTLYPGLQSTRYDKSLSAVAEVRQDAPTLDHERDGGTRQALAREGRSPITKGLEICEPLDQSSEIVEEGQRPPGGSSAATRDVAQVPTYAAAPRSSFSPSAYKDSTPSTHVSPIGVEFAVSHLPASQLQSQRAPLLEQQSSPNEDHLSSCEKGSVTLSPNQRRSVEIRNSLDVSYVIAEGMSEGRATLSTEMQAVAADRHETAPTDPRTYDDNHRVGDNSCSGGYLDCSTSGIPSCAVECQKRAVSGVIRVQTSEVNVGNTNTQIIPSTGVHSFVHYPSSKTDYSAPSEMELAIGTSEASKKSELGRVDKLPTSPIMDRFPSILSTSTASEDYCHSSSLPSSPSSCNIFSIDRHRPNSAQVIDATGPTGSQPINNYNRILSPRKPPEVTSTLSSQSPLQESFRFLQDFSPIPTPEEIPHSPLLNTAPAGYSQPSPDILQDLSDTGSLASSESISDASDSESDTENDSPNPIDTATKLALLKPIRAPLASRLHHTGITVSVINFIQSCDTTINLPRTVDVPKANQEAGSKRKLLDSLKAIIPVLLPLLPNPNLVSRLINFIMSFPAQAPPYQNGIAPSNRQPQGIMPQTFSQAAAGQSYDQLQESAPTCQQFISPHQLHQGLSPSGSMQYCSQPPQNCGPIQAPIENRAVSTTAFHYASPLAVASTHPFPSATPSQQPAAHRVPSVGPTATQHSAPRISPETPQQRIVPANTSSQSRPSVQSSAATAAQLQLFQQHVSTIIADLRPSTESDHNLLRVLRLSHNAINYSFKKTDELQKTIDEQNKKIAKQNGEVERYKTAAGRWAVNNPKVGLAQGVYLEREVARLQNALQTQAGETEKLRHAAKHWMNRCQTLEAMAARQTHDPTPPTSTPPSQSANQVIEGAIEPYDLAAQPHNQAVQPGDQGAAIDLTKSPELSGTHIAENPVSANAPQGHKRKLSDGVPRWIEFYEPEPRKASESNTANPQKRQKVAAKEALIPAPWNSNHMIPRPFDYFARSNYTKHRDCNQKFLKHKQEKEDEERQANELAQERARIAAEQARKEQEKAQKKERDRLRRQKQKDAIKARQELAEKKAAEEERAKAEAEAAQKMHEEMQAAKRAEENGEEEGSDLHDLDELFEEAEDEDEDQEQLARDLENALTESQPDNEELTEEELERALMDNDDNELVIDWGEPLTAEELAAQGQRDADFAAYAATRCLPQPPVQDESEESEEE